MRSLFLPPGGVAVAAPRGGCGCLGAPWRREELAGGGGAGAAPPGGRGGAAGRKSPDPSLGPCSATAGDTYGPPPGCHGHPWATIPPLLLSPCHQTSPVYSYGHPVVPNRSPQPPLCLHLAVRGSPLLPPGHSCAPNGFLLPPQDHQWVPSVPPRGSPVPLLCHKWVTLATPRPPIPTAMTTVSPYVLNTSPLPPPSNSCVPNSSSQPCLCNEPAPP